MKKVFLSLLFVAVSAMTFAQQWTSISKGEPAGPEVKLVSSSEKEIVVDFALGGFSLSRVNTPNGTSHVVNVPEMASMLEAGAPDLPHFPIPAIIGDMAEMSVSVESSEHTDYENVEIAPSKGNFSRQIDPATVPYSYGAMYSKNAFYPSTQAHLEAPYIIRDFRGQNIMVTPFAYNPTTKTLRVYHKMTIAMKKVSDNGQNQKAARKANRKLAPEMKAAYKHRFINFNESSAKYTFIEDRGEMLIICPDQYLDAMQPLVDWKNQSGRPTTMVSVTEAGGNNNNAIKSYIQSVYDDPERNLEFILLVGDYADLTPHSMTTGYSDNWFGQLEGTDYYIEAFTGRFSAENSKQLETQVEKVIHYERNLNENDTWLSTGIGIAANEGAGNGHNGGEADYVHMNYIRDTLSHYTYQNVTQQYAGVGSGTNANAISSDINTGASIINYCNHGSQTSWAVANYSNSHVNALVNDDKLPFIWSVACDNGKFNGTCFAEAWLRASNANSGRPTGAVGGMFSWISQPWQPPMTGQDEMVNILTEWKSSDQYNHTFGGASLNGNMYILDMHPSDAGATHNTWLLFGDPSLMVRTDVPASMNVSCTPPVLMLGMSNLQVDADNTDFGIATLMMDGEILGSSYIQNGTADIEFDALSTVGTATLTVIGYNKVTEVIEMNVLPAEGAYVSVNGFTPNFVPVNQETTLSMSYKNVGVDPTQGVTTISLGCDDERLSILDGTAEFGVLAADETIDLEDAFSVSIAEDVEDGTRFQVNVTMTCGSQVWNGKVNITAAQAVLNFAEVSWAGSFTPGETVTIVAKFKNEGHYRATNAVGHIMSESQYLTFINEEVEIGTIDPNGMAICVFEAMIDATCPETEQIPVSFNLTADANLSAQGSLTMKNSCNIIIEMNDDYGDGWNNAKLKVGFDDGTPEMTLTCNGSSSSQAIEVGSGVHVTLTWSGGYYDYECSFIVKYDNDIVIYQMPTNSNPSSGLLHEFDCNCGSAEPGTTLAPVENLNYTTHDNAITLSWEAPRNAESYTILRNGVEIANVSEATYTDELDREGSYTYCVMAEYEQGSALPVCIDISAEWGVEDSEIAFAIYPNPASNTLHINGGSAEYSYEMLNGMGQTVASGKGRETMQINVSDMAKGVYFLRLTNGSQVVMQKVVVE